MRKTVMISLVFLFVILLSGCRWTSGLIGRWESTGNPDEYILFENDGLCNTNVMIRQHQFDGVEMNFEVDSDKLILYTTCECPPPIFRYSIKDNVLTLTDTENGQIVFSGTRTEL